MPVHRERRLMGVPLRPQPALRCTPIWDDTVLLRVTGRGTVLLAPGRPNRWLVLSGHGQALNGKRPIALAPGVRVQWTGDATVGIKSRPGSALLLLCEPGPALDAAIPSRQGPTAPVKVNAPPVPASDSVRTDAASPGNPGEAPHVDPPGVDGPSASIGDPLPASSVGPLRWALPSRGPEKRP